MLKVMMHGCNGKMGQVITKLIDNDIRLKIAAGIDGFQGINNPYPVFASIMDCDIDVDVIIDFSNSKAVDDLLKYSVANSIPLILCTTGMSKDQLQLVHESTKKIPILKSANMSLGINLLLKLLGDAAKTLGPAGYDIEIVERHHNQKIDAPSGTALALADSINSALDNEYQYVYNRSNVRMPRDSKEIGISAVRAGTIVGEHEIIFGGIDEVIELKHTAYSRSVFAKGAVEAANFLVRKPPGLYSMSDVIG